jgi:hypothetical protein
MALRVPIHFRFVTAQQKMDQPRVALYREFESHSLQIINALVDRILPLFCKFWITAPIAIGSHTADPSRQTGGLHARGYQRLLHDIDRLSAEAVRAAFRIPEEYLSQLKFSECLPQRAAEEMMKDRLLQPGRLKTVPRTNKHLVLEGFN